MKRFMVRIGNFFFRWRDKVFPLIVLTLFVLAVPPNTIFQSEKLEEWKDYIAIFIAFCGLAFRALVIGYAYIKRGGVNKKVYAENLVTEGMFGVCRNPLYVGNMLIYVGVFLMHGNPMVMVLGITLYAFIYQCIIYAEEAYLLNKFGEGYLAYCADVPRWIPKFSRLREAIRNMKFNARRVLIKDYSTAANTIVTLTLVEMYEYLALPHPLSHIGYLYFLIGVIVLSVASALTIRVLKKRKLLVDTAAA
jgi:protein-S-isoprenylcysteine O-methyltransferase Ste14